MELRLVSSVEVIVSGSACAQLAIESLTCAAAVESLVAPTKAAAARDEASFWKLRLLSCFGCLGSIRSLFGRGRLTDDNQAVWWRTDCIFEIILVRTMLREIAIASPFGSCCLDLCSSHQLVDLK
jgi:hypothetical protein